jgi:hypothetical protein
VGEGLAAREALALIPLRRGRARSCGPVFAMYMDRHDIGPEIIRGAA